MPSLSNRNKRLILIAAVLSLAFAFYILNMRQELDFKLWNELQEGINQLIPFLNNTTSSYEKGDVAKEILSMCPGVFIFSLIGIWAGYKKLWIPGLAILVLGIFYQALASKFFNSFPRAIEFGILTISSFYIGYLFKRRENELKAMETADAEIELRNNDLQKAGLEMVKQDEEGRRLMAADLHDQVLNDMRNILSRFEQYTKEPDEDLKKQITDQMAQSMSDIRELMDDLCPTILSEFGLCPAIEDRLDKAAKQFKLKIRFNSSVDDDDLDKFDMIQKQLIYRLVQESITNLCKHAKATQVKISVSKQGELIVFRTTDDGIGIDPAKMSDASRGTMYMRLRAKLINATVSWEVPENGKGTDFVLSVPLPSKDK